MIKEQIANDIIARFEELQDYATKNGFTICLNTETSTPLVLYWHEDYENRILVDKYISNKQKRCRHCGRVLSPTDVDGYSYVCHHCNENFYEFEF